MRGLKFLTLGVLAASSAVSMVACGESSNGDEGGEAGSGTSGTDSGGTNTGGTSAGTTSGGSSGSGSGSGGAAGNASGGSSSGGASSGGSSSGGASNGGSAGTGGGACAMDCARSGFVCCGTSCVNTGNDVKNCGGCGNVCAGSFPYCDNGTCGPAPCGPLTDCIDVAHCCNTECCGEGQLCCVVPAGAVRPASCFDAVNDTCPLGCPMCDCASPDTPIATPTGERPISEIRRGDLVYSVESEGIIAVPVKQVNANAVSGHYVLRVRLANGAVLEISAMHPTADGRTLAALVPGSELDGVRVLSVEQIPYRHSHTYDILPDSETGAYYASGVLIGSTLLGVPPP